MSKSKQLACAAQHFGLWSVQAKWMTSAWAAYSAGSLPTVEAFEPSPLYTNVDGVAVIGIHGQIVKGESSFGGASSVRARQALRAALRDPDVGAIMLHVDSPGGSVAGTDELAQDVFAARTSGKPIATHADDLMASAALWVGSQASFVSASRMTEVGSIGTLAVVEDTSGMADAMGIRVHVVSTGPNKGAFVPGTEITDEQIAMLQSRVDAINEFFISAITRGRDLKAVDVRAMATGDDWLAADAASMGLIDSVMRYDDALERLAKEARQHKRERESASRMREQRIRRASL